MSLPVVVRDFEGRSRGGGGDFTNYLLLLNKINHFHNNTHYLRTIEGVDPYVSISRL